MAYLTPLTFDGNDIQSGSWQSHFAPRQIEGTLEIAPLDLEVAGGWPAPVDVNLQAREFALWCFPRAGTTADRRDEITDWFDPTAGSAWLEASDESGGTRRLDCRSIRVETHPEVRNGFLIQMRATKPIWEETVKTSASGEAVSACLNLFPSVCGNYFALPIFSLRPKEQKAGAAWSRNEKPFEIENNLGWRLADYPIECTAGGWDTTDLIAAGSMRDDGNDIEVIWRGQGIDRWVDNINTASTKVWIVVNLAASEVVSGTVVFGASAASAAVPDASKEPIFDHADSDNDKWIFRNFGTPEGTRPKSWSRWWDGAPAEANTYDWAWISQTGASLGSWSMTDPWEEMGVKKFNTLAPQGTRTNGYALALPVGISSLIYEGSRRLLSGSRSRLFLRYRTGSLATEPWAVGWDDTAGASAWTDFGPTTQTFSTCARQVLFKLSTPFLSSSPPTDDDFGFYISGACVALIAQPTVNSSAPGGTYHLTGSIRNATLSPSQSLALDCFLGLDEQLEIDCVKATVKNNSTGCPENQALSLDNPRRHWLSLAPGGSNAISYEESGAASVEVLIEWRHRWL